MSKVPKTARIYGQPENWKINIWCIEIVKHKSDSKYKIIAIVYNNHHNDTISGHSRWSYSADSPSAWSPNSSFDQFHLNRKFSCKFWWNAYNVCCTTQDIVNIWNQLRYSTTQVVVTKVLSADQPSSTLEDIIRMCHRKTTQLSYYDHRNGVAKENINKPYYKSNWACLDYIVLGLNSTSTQVWPFSANQVI